MGKSRGKTQAPKNFEMGVRWFGLEENFKRDFTVECWGGCSVDQVDGGGDIIKLIL